MALIFTLTVYYARGGQMAGWWPATWVATTALMLLICAAYVFNDLADVEYDKVNSPTRPLVEGQVRRRTAFALGSGLLLAGLYLGEIVGRERFYTLFLIVAVFTVLYDVFSKKLGLFKQLLVALLMTSIYPLAIDFSGGVQGSRAWTLLPFAIWVFLSSFAYEVLKDIRDRRGDAEVRGRRNWVQRRPRAWMIVASWLILLGALALIAPVLLGCRWIYLIGLPVVLLVAIRAAMARRGKPKIRMIYLEFVLVGIFTLLDVLAFGF
jgi:4-hydroxybenzoate polyprenyltransferase